MVHCPDWKDRCIFNASVFEPSRESDVSGSDPHMLDQFCDLSVITVVFDTCDDSALILATRIGSLSGSMYTVHRSSRHR